MFLALYLVVSIAPALFTFWRVQGWWAWRLVETGASDCRRFNHKLNIQAPTAFAHFCGVVMGIIFGALWPILCTFLIFRKVSGLTGGLGYIPKEIRETQLQRRIAQLEREAGICS